MSNTIELTRSNEKLPFLQRPVVFQLIEMRKNRLNPGYSEAPAYKGFMLSYDIEVNGKIERRTYRDHLVQKEVNGQMITQDLTPMQTENGFRNGLLTVRKDQPGLYRHLKDSPQNRDSGNKMHGIKPIFFEVNPEKDKSNAYKKSIEKAKAQVEIANMALSEVKAFATAFGVRIDQESDSIRHDLLIKAQKDPAAFLEDGLRRQVRALKLIEECLKRNILTYRKEVRQWSFTNPIPGKDPVLFQAKTPRIPQRGFHKTQFAKYLMTEANGITKGLLEQLLKGEEAFEETQKVKEEKQGEEMITLATPKKKGPGRPKKPN